MNVDGLTGIIDRLNALAESIGQMGAPGEAPRHPGEIGLDRARQAKQMGLKLGRGRRQRGCRMHGFPGHKADPGQAPEKGGTPSQVLGKDGPAKDAYRMAADPGGNGINGALEGIVAALRELAEAILNMSRGSGPRQSDVEDESSVGSKHGVKEAPADKDEVG